MKIQILVLSFLIPFLSINMLISGGDPNFNFLTKVFDKFYLKKRKYGDTKNDKKVLTFTYIWFKDNFQLDIYQV